jgi:hypothetical protein
MTFLRVRRRGGGHAILHLDTGGNSASLRPRRRSPGAQIVAKSCRFVKVISHGGNRPVMPRVFY